ncbi:MAG TPA: serine/threonine-protein kinase [Gemmatimonadaceae bacterium]|nr:serine/threonine-protein kinase [Gemmatimonadaceae bacterium]
MNLSDQIRDTLGPTFTVERELGGGGMSRVFVAYDQTLERRVVVKVLAPELMADVNAERFRREILVVAGLQHPHIVPVLSAGEMAGRPYLVMPFVEGESLRTRIARGGAMRVVEAVGVLRDVARALAYAHERGIVHRDIKPDNVLIHAGSAVVADFGVAKALDVARRTPGIAAQGTLTAAGASLGTPGYMAPEQIAADPNADYRVDIYAFGVTAYEALAGKGPFHGRAPHALLAAHLSEAPPSLAELRPEVPSALVSLVMRCLEKEPDRRPQNAQQILIALEDPAVLSGELGPATITGAAIAARTTASRRKRFAMLAMLGGAIAAAGGAAFILRDGTSAAVAPTVVAPVAKTPSIAVLPFVELASDSSNVAAEAIATELTSALARDRRVRVASGNSAQALQKRLALGQNVSDAVTLYVEGVVQREAGRVRVDARMVNAADGFMVWAQSYEGDAGQLLTLRTEIGTAVAEAVRSQLNLPADSAASKR